ncbi:hypothetical protein BD289DRAFT_429825 [Coniella lustricola]|uniref:Uncharacterized protein n=1 Tax=Coniella lustricola TaxID=2025994 RepID=A0A2T3ACN5_9PEZI|nr:hypothetical protein BD289DRAFT_429825 [Coniella lustricola]
MELFWKDCKHDNGASTSAVDNQTTTHNTYRIRAAVSRIHSFRSTSSGARSSREDQVAWSPVSDAHDQQIPAVRVRKVTRNARAHGLSGMSSGYLWVSGRSVSMMSTDERPSSLGETSKKQSLNSGSGYGGAACRSCKLFVLVRATTRAD